MGNSESRDEEFELVCRRFSESEVNQLKKLYLSLAAQSRSNGEYIIASAFQAYYGIHGALGSRLFDLVTQLRKDQRMTYRDFVTAKAKYEKGFPDEVEEFMFKLLDLNGDDLADREEVEAVILSMLETVLGPKDAVTGDGLPDSSVQAFLKPVRWTEDQGKLLMTPQEFHRWCKLVPSAKKFLTNILHSPGTVIRGRQVPQFLIPPKLDNQNIILRREHAWHIAGKLQPQECEDWMLLYHSSVNGASFNTFLKSVSVSKGCTILVIKDKEGCIYGGYASQPWEKHSEFYGDMKCFLFTLYPEAAIHRPSGSNSNLQWCAINYTSPNIPNGIGFGGQIHHFGLFIHSAFDRGSTYPSVTFNSPALSSQAAITPDVIECWGIVVKGGEEGDKGVAVGPKGTILERFKEERNMLNLVGIANASHN
ncbi:TLD domain-containing protein 1 [Selaginella moellendorffii]|uniref:TLD domain-containing protein 1 n=1 Tax=Selaginella moellendorffii TaxID=88036 RepID=UPI000D1CD08B|nr:TLD domain-containing protein 1 [Selaginella moellendorffii]|eukprot:XP_024535468.1 TLD domain-containing protein 1 [Selaginella moellendorffii]